MTTRWLNGALLAAGLWVLSTSGAWAITLQVVGGGLTATNLNYGCATASVSCQAQSNYDLAGSATASGTIDINAAGTLATISLYVDSVTFNPQNVGSSPITFSSLTYTGTAPIFTSGSTISGLGPGTGSVIGDVNGSPFSTSPSIFNLNCAFPGGTGQCGLTFGRTGFTNIQGEDWVHTFNVTVTVPVPEPATALLAALGVAGLLLRSRRA